ncbi:MAG: MinD/ParA family protein [Deltaproteobacteria bacterium]|nr:MinD/ParA family protein [Deltaproteobacteria bacterium]MBN2674741.1 MinD/ParA family protein [Deltaproteobacteria bacterium]
MNSVIDTNQHPIQLPRVYRGKGLSIISITGGKGGVGKSTVSVNLSIALSQLGGRVLLLDGDLAMANADQMLGVHVPTTLWNVIQGEVSLSDSVVDTPWGISLICASSGRKEMAELGEMKRQSLLDQVRELGKNYDYVVIDTPAGIGGVSIDFASAADLVLAVATPDPSSVRDVFAIMKVLSKDKGIKRINLVANMVSTNSEGVDLFKRVSGVAARFLPVTLGLGGIIVKDPTLQRAIRERLPVLSMYPEAMSSKQISKLASQVVTLEREMLNEQSITGEKRSDR